MKIQLAVLTFAGSVWLAACQSASRSDGGAGTPPKAQPTGKDTQSQAPGSPNNQVARDTVGNPTVDISTVACSVDGANSPGMGAMISQGDGTGFLGQVVEWTNGGNNVPTGNALAVTRTEDASTVKYANSTMTLIVQKSGTPIAGSSASMYAAMLQYNGKDYSVKCNGINTGI